MKKSAALAQCNCFAIRQAARQVTRRYEHHLADAQLTSAQFSILAALFETKQMTMSELASVMVMDRTTLLRAMKPLQREAFISSGSSAADTRQLVFSLTPAGERKFKQALPLWNKAQSEFETEVGSREAARLRSSLLGLAEGEA